MMRHWLIIATCICYVVGWWELGHITVAQIAKNYLNTTGKTDTYNKFNELIVALNDFTDGKSNTFIESSVWPDDIKTYKATFFDDYHFTNIIYDPQHLLKNMTDLQRDVNAANIVGWCMTVLKANKNGISFQRAFMARYLLHLVGDIHQPLHSVLMYNNTYKSGDAGGNNIKIKTKEGQSTNLHAFMDSMAGEQSLTQRLERPLNDSGKAKIETLAQAIIKQFPPEYFGQKINNFSPIDWTFESYDNAVKDVYSFIEKESVATTDWTTTMNKLCRERVALAGYRLAKMISNIYA